MLTSQEINALGQICNDTWGYPNGLNSKVPTSAVKMSIQDNKMTCTYTTIINLASDRHLRDQIKKFEEESISIVRSYFSEVKKEFKKVTGRALKSKETGTDDSIEIITTSPFTPKRTAYYRRFTTYDVD
tara:strand:- start:5788 stop:6174 length:387 start_codon:yes stop_codon:yes gene_type:complete